MANISVSFTTTAKQDAKLAKILLSVNAVREQQELAPFPNMEAYLRFVLIEAVKGWSQQQSDADGKAAGIAYEAASDSVRAQVQTLLGL
jgi:hypothetical protein